METSAGDYQILLDQLDSLVENNDKYVRNTHENINSMKNNLIKHQKDFKDTVALIKRQLEPPRTSPSKRRTIKETQTGKICILCATAPRFSFFALLRLIIFLADWHPSGDDA